MAAARRRSRGAHDPEAIACGLWRASLLWRRAVQQALRPLELTLSEYLVLASLVRLTAGDGEAQSQRELADDAGLDPMTTSQAVRSLDDRGLLTREVNYVDGRRWLVLPTPRGEALHERAAPEVQSVSVSFVAPLGAQLPRFGRLLGKLR
ncbi:MAG: MarR family transcriptional regulator [Deltaproteobacteria bacterium]|nr:MarR family transcriptional regulator [Deltaproteobacteria bacterium]